MENYTSSSSEKPLYLRVLLQQEINFSRTVRFLAEGEICRCFPDREMEEKWLLKTVLFGVHLHKG